jgi:hypothetical protein
MAVLTARRNNMKKEIKIKRPILVTILAILGFILAFISILDGILGMLIPELRLALGDFPFWFFIFLFIIGVLDTIALIGIWKMLKKGLIAYTVLTILDIVITFSFGFIDINGVIIDTIIFLILPGLFYLKFKKMN